MNKSLFVCLIGFYVITNISPMFVDNNQQQKKLISPINDILKSNFNNFLQTIENYQNILNSRNDTIVTNEQMCMAQIISVLNAVNNSEIWALKIIDAWGKILSGILSGNVYELGQFDECINIEQLINSPEPNTIRGQYCLAQISIERNEKTSNIFNELSSKRQLKKKQKLKGSDARLLPTQIQDTFGLNIGICIPDSCSAASVTQFLNNILNISNISALGLVSSDLCHTKATTNFDALDVFTISFFGIVVLLIGISTLYDILMTRNEKNKKLGLTAFSIYSNGQKLFRCQKSNSDDIMDCLNGIRVLSIVWVVFGHTHMLFVLGPLTNPSYLVEFKACTKRLVKSTSIKKEITRKVVGLLAGENIVKLELRPQKWTVELSLRLHLRGDRNSNWISHVYSMLLVAAPVSVDSFFLLSGLLVTLSCLKHLDSNNGKLNIFLFYFHRYIRLTPSLAALILLCSSLLRHVGDGPLWDVYMNAADQPCQKYWWSALLYVQNYVNPSGMCIGHSWYLSVDMQLFVLSPLIIYPLWRWRQKFVWVIPLLTSLSMGCVFAIFIANKFSTQLLAHMMGGDSMTKTYYPTHTRMGAWLVGVLLGYILHNIKGKALKVAKTYIVLGWFVAVGTMLSIIFGIYFMQQPDYEATLLESAFYESFSRVSWSISLSWIIFACIHGYGGPVNWFLSLPQWQPLARLSYSIYLTHLPLQLTFIASSRTQLNFNDFMAIHKFWGDFGMTLCIAVCWTLAFESPVLVLEKLFFTPTSKITVSREDLVRQNINSIDGTRSNVSAAVMSNKVFS